MMFAVADAYQEWYDLSEEEVVETLKAQNFG
jgi:predicted phosphoribosyltransferase